MCRSASAVLLLTVLLVAAPARADDVAGLLERLDLPRLLARHLEQRLEAAADADERQTLLRRLAGLYARLLETAPDDDARADLEQRSRLLLRDAPEDTADELRLALLRATYVAAERVAAEHRLRLADEAELERARAALAEVVAELESLRARVEDRVERLERRLGRASGRAAVELTDEVREAEALRSSATFTLAWAIYYDAWLADRPEPAKTAIRLFAELLAADSPYPQPTEISVDLRAAEPVARSILGMALCRSFTGSALTALEWIDLLEHPTTFEPLRVQSDMWRLVILLEHGEYAAVRDRLRDRAAAGAAVPATWLRLVAVHAMEEPRVNSIVTELRRSSLAELAARGELQQVLELASRYGTEALGRHGFAARYVSAVLVYTEARQRHGGEAPTAEPALVAAYEAAEADFRAALAEPDVAAYPGPAAACRSFVAHCLFFRGEFRAASEAYREAARRLPAAEAPDALWMAIVSLDRIVQAGGTESLETSLLELVDEYLDRYPASERAPQLVLKRATLAPDASPDLVAQLLAVPPESPAYRQARAQAAAMLLRLHRAADAADRVALGNEFLNVAVGLLADERERLGGPDGVAPGVVVTRCRQILEIALSGGVQRLRAADAALAVYDELAGRPDLDVGHGDEIDARRVRLLLARDDFAGAERTAQALAGRGGDPAWPDQARKAIFREAHARWREAERRGEPARRWIDAVVEHGRPILARYDERDPDAIARPRVLPYYVAVAEAALRSWRETGRRATAELALDLHERLLERHPRERTALRAAAELAAGLDRHEQAVAHWRTLVAGSETGSPAWFEAKYHLIDALRRTYPAHARAVLEQHKLLHPELGPPPWDERLRRLDETLPAATSRSAAPVATEGAA